MKLSSFKIALLGLLPIFAYGAAEPIEPIRMHVQQILRLPLDQASTAIIAQLQKDGALPSSIDKIERTVALHNGTTCGVIKITVTKCPSCPAHDICIPNVSSTGPNDYSLIEFEDHVTVCDGYLPAHFIVEVTSDFSGPTVLPDGIAPKIFERALHQGSIFYGLPKEYKDLRTPSTMETMQKANNVRIGNETCGIETNIFTLAYIGVRLGKLVKNLFFDKDPIIGAVCDSELILPRGTCAGSLEKKFLSFKAFLDGQADSIKHWHHTTRSAAATNITIDFFKNQQVFIQQFIEACEQDLPHSYDPVTHERYFYPTTKHYKNGSYVGYAENRERYLPIEHRRDEAIRLLERVRGYIGQLEKCREMRKNNLLKIVSDTNREFACLTPLVIQQRKQAIELQIKGIHESMAGFEHKRNWCLSKINEVPGLLAGYHRYDKNNVGCLNALWDAFAPYTQGSLKYDLEQARNLLPSMEDHILNCESQLEDKLVRNTTLDALIKARYPKHIHNGGGSGPCITSDGCVCAKNKLAEDTKEKVIQEAEYAKQKEHIEHTWLTLSQRQKDFGDLSGIEQGRLVAARNTIANNGARYQIATTLSPELEAELKAMKVNTKAFKEARLNNYQIQLMSEQIANISRAFQLKHERIVRPELAFAKPIIDDLCSEAIETSLLANDCDRLMLDKQSELLNGLANIFLEHGAEIIKTVDQTWEKRFTEDCHFAGRAFLNPCQAINETTSSFVELAKELGSFLVDAEQRNVQVETIERLMIYNPAKAETLLEQYAAETEAFENAVKAYWANKPPTPSIQVTHTATEIATEFAYDIIVYGRIFKWLHKGVAGMRKFVAPLKKICSAEQIEAIAAETVEGFKVKVGHEMLSECVKIAEASKELGCEATKSNILEKLKHYIKNGIKEENRITYMLEADTTIVFRKDFGEHAHTLTNHGYMQDIDHYNIDFAKRRFPGTGIDRWDEIKKFHIIVDKYGTVTDFF